MFAAGAAAQNPGNGILSWHVRLPAGPNEGGLEGVGPVGASGVKALFPGVTRAIWSPDGNSALLENLVFGVGSLHLWTADRGTSNTPIVRWTPEQPTVFRATWSPGGKRFAYARAFGGNAADAKIYVANADGSDQHLLLDTKGGLGPIAWGRTPSGERIAFVGGYPKSTDGTDDPGVCTHCVGNAGIWIFDPDSPESASNPVLVPNFFWAYWAGSITAIDWNPNGSGQLLVSAIPDIPDTHYHSKVCDPANPGGVCYFNGDIYLVDTQTGGEPRNLTHTGGWAGPYEAAAVWSPDGTQIAYSSAGPKAWESIWVANYTGGSNPHLSNPRLVSAPAPMTQVKYFSNPSWQPCRTPVTKVCTVQAFGSTVGKSISTTPGKRQHH
jgi:Tol biopolymer transport system component